MGYIFRVNPAVRFCIDAVRKGLLGRVFELDLVMSRMDGQNYRDWLSQYQGGAFFIFECHLTDLVMSMMGRPQKIVPFMKKTRPEVDGTIDNGLSIFEYKYASATIRAAVVEVNGFLRLR